MSRFAEELDAVTKREFIAKAREKLLAFTLYTKPDYQVGWHHQKLAKKLDQWISGEIKYLMVFMPPRHGKTELVSRRLPALLHGLYPDCEIMAASYLDTLAGDITVDVQNVIDSKEYKTLFPDTRIFPPSTIYSKGVRNSSEHHIIGHKGKYRGQGIGGSFTGKGASYILVDDPIKGRDVADSVAFREKLWNFWSNDLFSRLETNLKTGRQGQVLITQTRWHESDLSGQLIDLMKEDPKAIQWEILNYPAIRVNSDDETDPRQIGEALWPQKYNIDQLEQIKATVGVRGWSSLYQQNPTPDGGSMFKDEMFEFRALPKNFDYKFTTADTAYNDKKENDFTVFTTFGMVAQDLYVIDVYRKQVQAAKVEQEVKPYLLKHIDDDYRQTWIEPKGHGIYLNQAFKNSAMRIPSENDLSNFYKDRNKNKTERANNVLPHLSNKKIYINESLPLKEELLVECLNFPKGKHDDFVDTVIDALKIAYGKAPSIFDLL